MKIALINTKQSGGGAAIAAQRLHKALCKHGVDATLVVAEGEGGENIEVISKNLCGKIKYKTVFLLERAGIWLKNRLSRKNLFAVSTALYGTNIAKHRVVKDADIIHLHWVNQGMLSLKGIEELVATGKPIVITPHDMWYATAICHHAGECNNYTTECKNCPCLERSSDNDLAIKVWRKKEKLYSSNVTFIAISKWMMQRLKTSQLTTANNHELICNVMDTDTFRPHSKEVSRQRLGLLPTEKVLAFGAAKLNDPIKGADMLFRAIEQSGEKEQLVLLLFGTIKNDEEFLQRIPCRYIYVGEQLSKEELAQLYSASDMVVVPSHYESLSLVIAEAMACGTPAVSFNNAGQTMLIDHKENGYLAEYPSTQDFANGINWIFKNAGEKMRKSAIAKIDRIMSPDKVASQHIELYKRLLKKE